MVSGCVAFLVLFPQVLTYYVRQGVQSPVQYNTGERHLVCASFVLKSTSEKLNSTFILRHVWLRCYYRYRTPRCDKVYWFSENNCLHENCSLKIIPGMVAYFSQFQVNYYYFCTVAPIHNKRFYHNAKHVRVDLDQTLLSSIILIFNECGPCRF